MKKCQCVPRASLHPLVLGFSETSRPITIEPVSSTDFLHFLLVVFTFVVLINYKRLMTGA